MDIQDNNMDSLILNFLLPHIPSPLHRTLHRVFLPHLQTGPVVEVHIP